MRPGRLIQLGVAIGAALLGGCATAPNVAAPSLTVKLTSHGLTALQDQGPASYVLRLSGYSDPPTPSQHESLRRLKRALAARGLREAPSSESAGTELEVALALGAEIKRIEYVDEPITETVPGGMRRVIVPVGLNADGTPIYISQAQRKPDKTKITGYRKVMAEKVTRETSMRLGTAREWQVTATAYDGLPGLPPIEQTLAAAIAAYLAERIDRDVEATVSGEDVAFVNKGSEPAK